MEDKGFAGLHRLSLSAREEMKIEGVSDVTSFDENMIIVETPLGVLEIHGEGLHVNQLNLENGEMNLTGEIRGLQYDDRAKTKTSGKSLMNRLFG